MIVNNFSKLLGERLLKITTVAKDTGISRTTLTNLYYRRSQAVSFEVIDKLCDYLDCDLSDLFEHKKDTGAWSNGNDRSTS